MNKYYKKYLPSVADIEFCRDAMKKCRVLSLNTNWELPKIEDLFRENRYEIDELKSLQTALHECKSQLNHYEPEDWRLHTRRRNLVATLMYELKSENKCELLIQSFFKLWEALHLYKLVPKDAQNLFSVHLCEAPGAFISALNHFLKQTSPSFEFDWLATSINPYLEDFDPEQVINDDRIIRHTIDKWVFGPDNSGNLFKASVVEELQNRAKVKEVNNQEIHVIL